MKKAVAILFLMWSANTFAQLYVSSGSSMYVKDQVVFVKQDIDLQNNSNIYLRNEAQLLQGTASTSTNKGLGKLSVFQEGTSDNYDYNYWCSPIGNASATTGNEGFGITMIQNPLTTTNSAVSVPTGGLDGTASPFAISSYWIYKYISSATYADWLYVGAASNFAAGEGFTMKGTSGTDITSVDGVQNNIGSAQRYDFRGKPNDGNIAVSVGLDNMTLTGNPYPSALHVNAFLLDPANTACDGIGYYWEQNKSTNSHYLVQYQGGYGTYSPVSLASNGIYVPAFFSSYDGSGNLSTTGTSSGLVIERKYAPIGQGFMILGTSNGSVTLKNAHREYYKESGSLSQFERSSNANLPTTVGQINQVPHIRLNAIMNNTNTAQIALALIPEATDGIDRGIDAKSSVATDIPNDVYFVLDNAKYVIEGTNFDIGKRIPIGVKSANNSTFRFYVPEVVNFDENQQIYIFDANDSSYHNIKTGNFDITLEAGVYNNRFEITFTDAALGIPNITDDNFAVIQDNASQMLEISNPKGIEIKSCSLYDMAGKLIFTNAKLGSDDHYNFSTSGISEGIYIAKIITSNQDFGQKISVFRNHN
ncbi:MAG TPA: T9SS type A sorting domain-containing protein [Flavobacterium sp.]|nr:T9SS type A sorting domain-containing protein [Flavobacterium sp.]